MRLHSSRTRMGLTSSHGSRTPSLARQVSSPTSSAVILQVCPENGPNSTPFASRQTRGRGGQQGHLAATSHLRKTNPLHNTDIPGVVSDNANCSITDLFEATTIPPPPAPLIISMLFKIQCSSQHSLNTRRIIYWHSWPQSLLTTSRAVSVLCARFYDKYLPASEREAVKPFVTNEEPLPGLMKIECFPEISIIHLVSRCG